MHTSAAAKAGGPANGPPVPGRVERPLADTGSRHGASYPPGRSNAPAVLHDHAAFYELRLDHKEAAKRMVELPPFKRSEVAVTVAWGLRKLDVPET